MTIEPHALALAASFDLDEPEPASASVEIICGELRTGRILTTVPVSGASWSMVYNDAGAVEATIPLGSLGDDAAELVGYLDPARCYLAAVCGDSILEAGPIWTHGYESDSRALTVRAAGLWSLFDHRKVVKVLAPGEWPEETYRTYTGLSLGTIAKRLVQLAMSHTGGSLPMALPPDETAADDEDHERTWYGYELKDLGEALRQLTEVINGPDIRFEPRFTADRLRIEWVMKVGTEAQPLVVQSGGDWRWDTTVPRGPVSGLSVERDATGLAYRAWVPGSGEGLDSIMSMREDLTPTTAGYPLLEAVESHTSVVQQSTLDAHAQALLDVSRRPWMKWTWQTQAGEHPRLGDARPGDWARVNVPHDHPYLRALGVTGEYRTRILGISGDLGPVVKIEAAPTMEAR